MTVEGYRVLIPHAARFNLMEITNPLHFIGKRQHGVMHEMGYLTHRNPTYGLIPYRLDMGNDIFQDIDF